MDVTSSQVLSDSLPIPDATEHLVYYPRFIDPSQPTGLWFCDSPIEMDAVKINAVCLPTGAAWDELNQCTDFFAAFPYILIASADPAKRAAMTHEIQMRVINAPILVAKQEAFCGCKSLSELVSKRGTKAVYDILRFADEIPVYGLLNLADVKTPDLLSIPRTLSGFADMDRAIGGFYAGELSVWTGKRGDGKSTLTGQILVESVDQGHRVCAYSGELPAWRFRRWTLRQAAGPGNVVAIEDKLTGRPLYEAAKPAAKLIDEWWDKRFFLYDIGLSSAHDEDSIMKLFEYSVRRYGCDVFLVDNIMTARLKGANDRDFYRAQSNFVGRLVQFAKTNNVHVHLVAHPRKADGGRGFDADDISGTGDITNRADNVFLLQRLSDEDAATQGYSSVLSVLKNRTFGRKIKIGLNYDEPSLRLYKSSTGTPHKMYMWEKAATQEFIELSEDAENPFEKSLTE